jgi:thiamine-phosphate pyrophosphorylase
LSILAVKGSLPRLYPILDTAAYKVKELNPVAACTALLTAGVRLLQYRHKAAFTQERFDEARQVAALCRGAGASFIMNDRADFAKLLECGLHLGQEDLPVESARGLIGPDHLIGISTHNEAQFRKALETSADYVAVGPIFNTQSKQNPDPEVGLSALAALRNVTKLPLVAIGGISLSQAPNVIASGADSLAVISALLPEKAGDLNGLENRAGEWLKAVE